MSTFAIGDVQGCFEALMGLLERIHFNPQEDTLWFTGDLVNRGPQSLEVLRFLHSLPRPPVVVLGNHELHLLVTGKGYEPQRSHDTLDQIFQAPDGEILYDWVRHFPLVHYDAQLGYVLVHAGFAPQWDLLKILMLAREFEAALQLPDYELLLKNLYGDQPLRWEESLTGIARLRTIANYCTRLRFCTADGMLNFTATGGFNTQLPGYMPWFQVPNRAIGNTKVLFGHWSALRGITHDPQFEALDTGCVWGGTLTALRLEDGVRFSFPL